MDSIPIIVSTVLLVLLVPTVAYIFITTPTKEDFVNHTQMDAENMREIRKTLENLGTKIDNAMLAMLRAESGGRRSP